MSDIPASRSTRTDGRRPLVFSWGVSSFFGWGVYGLNLMLHLAEHAAIVPLCTSRFGPGDVVLDPLRHRRLAAMSEYSAPLWNALGTAEGEQVEIGHTLLEGMGNDLESRLRSGGKILSGRPSIGVLFTARPRSARKRSGAPSGSR